MKAFVASKRDEIEKGKKITVECKWRRYREFYKLL